MIFNSVSEDPLFVASQFFAINPPSKYKRIYTAIFLTLFITLTYGVGLFFNSIRNDLSILVNFSLWLQLLGETIIVVSDFLAVLISPDNFRSPKNELIKIETNLENFGFVVDDETLINRFSRILQILLAFGLPFGFGFLDFLDVIKGENLPYSLIYFTHYVLALTVINVTEFLFYNYLHMIKKRFKELNRTIYKVTNYVIENRNVGLKKNEDGQILEQLNVARKAHYDLTQIAQQVNKSYGPHLLLSITFSIILITEQLYQNYEAIALRGRTVVESLYTNYTWTVYHITRISLIIFACYSTCAEANETASLIHSVPMKNLSQKLKDEIFYFSLQTKEKLNFTAAGFFRIDLPTFTNVTGAVVTYLIIMIQMQSVNQV